MTLGQLDALPVAERLARYAEDAQDFQKCPIHNGPLDECDDDAKVWYPQRLVCRKSMDLAAADRKYAELHEAMPFHDGTFTSWAKDRSASHPFHFSDGVRIWVSDVDYSPDDQFLQG